MDLKSARVWITDSKSAEPRLKCVQIDSFSNGSDFNNALNLLSLAFANNLAHLPCPYDSAHFIYEFSKKYLFPIRFDHSIRLFSNQDDLFSVPFLKKISINLFEKQLTDIFSKQIPTREDFQAWIDSLSGNLDTNMKKDEKSSEHRVIWMSMDDAGLPIVSAGKGRPSDTISRMNWSFPFLIFHPIESMKFVENSRDLIRLAMGAHPRQMTGKKVSQFLRKNQYSQMDHFFFDRTYGF